MGSCRNGKFKSGKGAESMETHKGLIIHLVKNKGYGYIQPDDEQEKVFFHSSGVCNGRFEDLREAIPVNYFLVEYKKKGETRRKAIGVVSV